tara:strand:+ start:500 stop:817 length:318 start_codon:yes stop_codon:yes gene_type:complete
MYVLAWKFWEHDGTEAVELAACTAWEEAFSDVEEQAKMSIESKVNERMSEIARQQAAIWAKRNKMTVLVAERKLSEAWEYEFPTDQARSALEVSEQEEGIPAGKS